MQTYSEITAAEQEVRTRAARWEYLSGERARQQAAIDRLERSAVDTTVLVNILNLSKDLPQDIVTVAVVAEGRTLAPGGFSLQSMLQGTILAALDTIKARDAKRLRQLEYARLTLTEVEKALQDEGFNQ